MVICVLLLFMFMGMRHIKFELISNRKVELVKTAKLVGTMTEALFDTSIQNYLRGISETHLSTTEYYYTRYKEGFLTEEEAKNRIEALFLHHRIGNSGYVTSVDISGGRDEFVLAIHPELKGFNNSEYEFVQKMADKKNGYMEFWWKNPGEEKNRLKAEYMSYFEPWQWIINAAPYKSEFYSLLDIELIREYLDRAQISKTEGSYVMVFDVDGNIIFHPLLSGENVIEAKDAKTGEPFLKNLIDDIRRYRTSVSVDGWLEFSYTRRGAVSGAVGDKLMYYTSLPEYRWVVATVINKDEILEPYYSLQEKLAATAVLAVAALIFIALASSRYITNRLAHVVQAAGQLAKNRYDIEVKRQNGDEIGDLEEAFGEAASKIQALIHRQEKLNEELEDKVRERTNELAEKNEELSRLYVTDRLTGLYNRHKLDELLNTEWYRMQRNRHHLGIILLDIDHFKAVNDSFGHQVGDQVLVEFAGILKDRTRKTDNVGRWGGEEFLIICNDTDETGVKKLAESLKLHIEEHEFPAVGTRTSSFGAAVYRVGESLEGFIHRVDSALYRAKENGRNRVEMG